jgi:hypothetical protein
VDGGANERPGNIALPHGGEGDVTGLFLYLKKTRKTFASFLILCYPENKKKETVTTLG